MLAGNLKLKHFLLIIGALGAASIGGVALMCSGQKDESVAEPKAEDVVTTTAPQPATRPLETHSTAPVPVEIAAKPSSLRDVDKELMSWVGKNLGSEKIKDAAKGRAWKINLYQDVGTRAMGRAKIDLDRDDKWDEKWTFDGNNISRKVAPNDDEEYSQEFDWNGSNWTAR